MNVLLPQRSNALLGENDDSTTCNKYRVLYLLHGLSDDHTTWMRRTSIERYAADYNLVVVMPDGARGFYTDHVQGPRYWTMLAEELPALVADWFPVSTRREDTFAAGLSMGGYGALKLALRCPERFAAAVALSAVADVQHWLQLQPDNQERQMIFGDEGQLQARGNDLLPLATAVAKSAAPPRLMLACGTEDSLYQSNCRLRDHLTALNYPGFCFHDGPGNHNWAFWDEWIQAGLRFLMPAQDS